MTTYLNKTQPIYMLKTINPTHFRFLNYNGSLISNYI
jgi:hypothetical protein